MMLVIAVAAGALFVGVMGSILTAALWGEAVARQRFLAPLGAGVMFGFVMGPHGENGWLPVVIGPVFSLLGWLIYRSISATRGN